MTDSESHRRRRAFEIYVVALKLATVDRDSFVEREAANDSALREAVYALLASADEADEQGFMQNPVEENLKDAARQNHDIDPMLDRWIGPYRLLEILGEGGFGTVYLAEQSEPVFRKVALKLIRADSINDRLIARFEAERQTLALLSHPNVAQVFDAGTGPGGEPFLVMEYIDGIPITQYCEDHQLDVVSRLGLFTRVCEALQHAHQKGVIHRDIKPANVLVIDRQSRPVPKVIDFGIAKVLDIKVNQQTLATGTGFVGSPSYMSPEQIEQSDLDIDTRSDVYGLGVLLHEMMTGSPPFVAEGDSVVVLLNKILEQEPTRPSRYIQTTGRNSSAPAVEIPAAVEKSLSGDLDWIILKALSKDRDRRYESAAAFAADIRRYLNDEPVQARAPTLPYRVAKFVRRHSLGVAASAVILITLIGGVIGTGMGFVNARKEAANALEQTRNAEQTVALLLEFLTSADPREQGRELTVVALLESFKPQLGELDDRPAIQASLMHAYGRTYSGLGLFAEAAEFAEKAVALRETARGSGDPATIDSLNLQVDSLRETGDFETAERLGLDAIHRANAGLGSDHPLTLDASTVTARVMEKQGRFKEAESLLRSILDKRQASQGINHPDTLQTMSLLATTLWQQGKMEESEKIARTVLKIRRQSIGPDHPDTLVAMNELAVVITDAGRLDEGEALHRATMEKRKQILGPDHPKTLISMTNVAWVLGELGRYAESEALTRQAWEIEKRVLGPKHFTVLQTRANLSVALQRSGRVKEAEVLQRETLETMEEVLGAEHPTTMTALNDLAVVVAMQGRNEEARDMFQELSVRRKSALGHDHPGTLTTLGNLAVVHTRLQDYEAAEIILREVIVTKKSSMGAGHASTLISKADLATSLIRQQKLGEAEQILVSVLDTQEKIIGSGHPDTLKSVFIFGELREAQGRPGEAETLYRTALEGQSKALGTDHPVTLRIREKLEDLATSGEG